VTKPALSIFIPTFDRNDVLVETIRSLLRELPAEVPVTILDNASPTPVEDSLRLLLRPEQFAALKIIRHGANIGGNANITRCVELADSEWLWILGDDDPVAPGALPTIFREIAGAGSHVGLICFRSDKGGPHANALSSDLAELSQGISYDDFLFISTKILRLRAHRPHLPVAYHFCFAHCPQVALFLSALLHGGSAIILSRDMVVEQTIPPFEKRWSYVLFLISAANIALLPTRMEDKRRLGRWVAQCQFFTPLKVLAFIALFVPGARERTLYVKTIVTAAYFHNFRKRLLFLFAAPLFVYCPWLANLGTRAALRARNKALPTSSKRTL
jgi:glycosyltransferase involved in cell wall biosynthesis